MTTLTLTRQLLLPRPLGDVFRYLADFSTIEQWDPGVFSADKVTPGAPAIGSRFALMLNVLGRQVPMHYQLTQLAAPSPASPETALLVLRGEGEGFAATDTLALRARGAEQTCLDYKAVLDVGNTPGWMTPLLSLWGRRLADHAMTGLLRALGEDGEEMPGWSARLAERLVVPGMADFTRRGYRRMHSRGLSHRLDGRTVGISGATAGLGLAAAQQLARLGASLVLVGRGQDRLETAAASIRDFAGDDVHIELIEAELSSVAEAHRLADLLLARPQGLDVWINNAGALFDAQAETAEGHERALAINLITPALLMYRLAPMLGARGGRLINVVSGGLYSQALALDDMNYRNEPYNGAKAYARAKRGLLDLTRLWAAQPVRGQARLHAMHPGWAATPGVARSLPDFNRKLQRWLRNARMGADTMVWLASHPLLDDAALSGQFWFDRARRPSALVPGTETSAADVLRLERWLVDVAGLSSGAR